MVSTAGAVAAMQGRRRTLSGASATISGTVLIGETLTVSAPGATAYQWWRDGSPITGATSTTYVVTSRDIGPSIFCVATIGGPVTSNILTYAHATHLPQTSIGVSTSGLALADSGTTVDAWSSSLGGIACTLTAIGSTNRPVYSATAGYGGRPLATFDGSNDLLRGTFTRGTAHTDYEFGIVGRRLSYKATGDVWFGYTANNTITTHYSLQDQSVSASRTTVVGGANVAQSTYGTLTFAHYSGEGAGGVIYNRVGGRVAASSSGTITSRADGGSVLLGASYSASNAANIEVQAWYVGAALTSTQRAHLEALLAYHTGLSHENDLFIQGTHTRGSVKNVQINAQRLTQFAAAQRAVEDRGDGYGPMLNLEGAATSRARNSGPDSAGTAWTTASATLAFAVADGPLGPMTCGQVNLNAVSTARAVGTGTHIPTDNFSCAFAIWMRGVSGGEVVRLTWRDKTGTVYYGNDITLSTTWQRYDQTFNALTGASTLQLGIANSDTAPVAKSVYFAASFIDWGPVAASVQAPSSYIEVPSTAQITRSGDLIYVATGTDVPADFLTTGFEFDFVPDFSSAELLAVAATAEVRLAAVDNRNYLRFAVQSGDVGLRLVQGNLTRISLTGVTFSRGQHMTIRVEPAFSRITLSGATTGNGTATGASNTGWGEASGVNLYIGSSQTGSVPANGRYSRHLRTF